MSKSQRWKFLMPLAMAVLFFTAMVGGAWANEFALVAVAPSGYNLATTTTGQALNAAAGTVDPAGKNITLNINTEGDVLAGSNIRITAPTGMKFVNETGTSTTISAMAKSNTGTKITAAKAPDLTDGDTYSVTVNGADISWTDPSDGNAPVLADVSNGLNAAVPAGTGVSIGNDGSKLVITSTDGKTISITAANDNSGFALDGTDGVTSDPVGPDGTMAADGSYIDIPVSKTIRPIAYGKIQAVITLDATKFGLAATDSTLNMASAADLNITTSGGTVAIPVKMMLKPVVTSISYAAKQLTVAFNVDIEGSGTAGTSQAVDASDFSIDGDAGAVSNAVRDTLDKKKVIITLVATTLADGSHTLTVAANGLSNDLETQATDGSRVTRNNAQTIGFVTSADAVTSLNLVNGGATIGYKSSNFSNKITVNVGSPAGKNLYLRLLNTSGAVIVPKDTADIQVVEINGQTLAAPISASTTDGSITLLNSTQDNPTEFTNTGTTSVVIALNDSNGDTSWGTAAGNKAVRVEVATASNFVASMISTASVYVDNVKPKVDSTPNAAKALSATQAQLMFTEPVNVASVTTSPGDKFKLVDGTNTETAGDDFSTFSPLISGGYSVVVTAATVSTDGKTVTLTFDRAMPASALAKIVVASTVKDVVGNAINLSNQMTASFTTPGAELSSVSAVLRALDPKDPSRGRQTAVKFGDTVTVKVVGLANQAKVRMRVVDANDTSIVLVTAAKLGTGILDGTGNGSGTFTVPATTAATIQVQVSTDNFTTSKTVNIPVDTTAPTVTGATVSGNNKILVSFSEAVDPTSVAGATFTLSGGLTENTSARALQSDGKSVLLTLTNTMTEGTDYTVAVTGIQDMANNSISSSNSAVFTGAAADVNAPTVTVTLTDGKIVVTLTDEQNGSGVDMAASTMNVYGPSGNLVSGTMARSTANILEGSMTFTPSATLAAGTYTVTGSASDKAGNTVLYNQSVTVGTPAQTSPTLDPQTQLDPTAKSVNVTATDKTSVTIAPSLNVPTVDQGKSVKLYAAIVIDNQLYLLKAGLFGQNTWELYTGGAIPSMGTATLGATQAFDLGLNNINLTGFTGSFDVYYGYATQADLSDFVGSSYEVTVQ